MKATIITIGDELLIGQTVNTNASWLGSELSSIGFDIHKMVTIHDRREDILDALREASLNSDLVIITGGLGPTSDDITKPVLCEFFNTRLVLNHDVFNLVEEMLKRRKISMNENNRRQAEVPESCRVLENRAGTAPGMWFEKGRTRFISLPGVPNEMKYIMSAHVLPELLKIFTSQSVIHKNIMTYGVPEAVLAEMLEGFENELPPEIKLAYLPALGIIKLRLTATGKNREELIGSLIKQTDKVRKLIPSLIYGEDEESMEMVLERILIERGETISSAESCTGGRIASMFTSVPGSSGCYKGSVIAYSNDIKTNILGVPIDLIKNYGAVSREVVELMAVGVRRLLKTDYSVAVSGIAGPDGGTELKPVGTIWIAVADSNGIITDNQVFGTNRITNINRFSVAAINLLLKRVLSRQI